MVKTDALKGPIEDWLAAERLELFDLELAGAGPGRVVRVTVDADTPVDVERLADVSEGISRILDPLVDGPFQLEVSSPGLERPLRARRHYERSVGRDVVMKVIEGENTRVVEGTITAADDTGVTVDSGGTESTFAYESVASARTVFRWEPTPKPGKK